MLLVLAGCNAILGTEDVTGPGGDDDASVDAPESAPLPPQLRGPRLGASTGSVHATASLRPVFTWHASTGATRYELQVDDSCVVTSFRTCLFPSPEFEANDVTGTQAGPTSDLGVSLTPPVGRRYYWRVRACNAVGCSAYSDPWYIEVGRLADDVNGDGYGDVVVGIRSGAAETTMVGRAHVVFGQSGTATPTIVTLTDPRAEVDGHFGAAVAMVGDLNADGYGDVAVGAWNTSRASHRGWTYVYLGRGAWPATVPAESGGYGLAQPDAADHYGAVLAGGGDVNGDGYGDFSVAALEPVVTPTMPGYVYVNYGRTTLPSAQLGADRRIPSPTGAAGDAFGWSLTMDDINEDGYGDLLVGAIGANSFAGTAAFYFGGRDATAPPIDVTAADVQLSTVAGLAFFGADTTVCASRNGMMTIAIGAPLESAPGQGAGRVRLYRGRAPWPAEVTEHDAAIDDQSGAFRANMGASLACSDVTSDRAGDLVVAAPTPDDDGVVFLFDDVATLNATPMTTLSAGTGIVGHHVKVTDFNGDGVGDVVASRLRGPLTPAGAVLVWFGRQTWPGAITAADLTVPSPGGVAGENFGEALN